MRYRPIHQFIVIAFAMVISMVACQRTLTADKIISIKATSLTVLGDGSALDTIYANLPVDAAADLRGVSFYAHSGLFDNGTDTISVFANRTDISSGKITATVIFHASNRSGPDTVSASTSTVPVETAYLYFTLQPSVADSIRLIPSVYQLTDTFGLIVTVTAMLQNSDGGMVSLGTQVRFSDQPDTNVVGGGEFQPVTATLDSGSQVSTLYYPPRLKDSIGSYIQISGVVLNAAGNPTSVSSTTRIHISKL